MEKDALYFSSWQDQTVQIAKAVGKQDEGQALVDEVEDAYAEAAADHPEFAELTATFSQREAYDGISDNLQGWSTVPNLGAVKENCAVYTDTVLAGAIYFLSRCDVLRPRAQVSLATVSSTAASVTASRL